MTPVPSSSPTSAPQRDPSPQPGCRGTNGEVRHFSFPSSNLDNALNGRTYFPPCYPEGAQGGYPVVYLLHGAVADDEQWDLIGVDEAMDALLAEGRIPPFLVVMPNEPADGARPDEAFEKALVEELLPWVDEHYAARSGRTYRAIGGLSRGGNWAIRVGFKHWEHFAAIGGHSAPLFYGDEGRLTAWLEVIPEGKMPAIYLDIGQDDRNREPTRALENTLTDLGIPHEWHLFPGTHDESYWRSHLKEYLLWYASHWAGEG